MILGVQISIVNDGTKFLIIFKTVAVRSCPLNLKIKTVSNKDR
jgi:hypothetical protein